MRHEKVSIDGSASSSFSKILDSGDQDDFRLNYNRLPFQFSHKLGESSLFEVDRIADLGRYFESRASQRHRVGHVSIFTDDAKLEQGWDRAAPVGVRAADCLARIDTSHSWVLIRGIQEHPDYAHLPDQFVDELEAMLGENVRDSITWLDAYLFVSSPGMVTGYHIDHESNFLLQIKGTKELSLVDPADRSVITEEELERYYAGDMNAAKYSKRAAEKALTYALAPGVGVHHPPVAPHWARTGPEHSVSLSFPFCVRAFDRDAKIYQCNYLLRRLGIRPTPPRVSSAADRAKALFASDLGHKPESKYDLIRFGINKYRYPVRSLKSYVQSAMGNNSR